ncbi:MgtC/SapB family protein [Treponema sp.]|uniref:MgtC/SapB family protein n=1 Tax=Treponema sp. TaxID=166 RepID=UPI00388E25F9
MITDPIAQFLGPWSTQMTYGSLIFRILLSAFLSAVIGWERSSKRHSAGFRTFMIVTISSTLVMIIDLYLSTFFDSHFFILSAFAIISAARIATRTLFFTSRNQIMGLTTAVSLWGSCITGLAAGAGLYTITLVFFFIMIFCLSKLPSLEFFLKNRSNHFEIHLELKNSLNLQNFVTTIRKLGLTIDAIEMNPAYAGSGLSVYSIAISISSAELKKYKTHKEIIEALRTLDYIYHIEEI